MPKSKLVARRINKKQQFNRILFRWYQQNRRDFEWRQTRDPYKILVSEIMLQQTGTGRVIPKYREFLKKFPTIRKLATSSLGDVLRIWSGLGYNRRAKYLWETAKIIDAYYHGKLPLELHSLLKLPGIGRSTAAAIEAFSFGRDVPMIDTNIRRVILRVFFSGHVRSDNEIYEFARKLIPRGRGIDWNYAMLDIGATVCRATTHDDLCPFGKLHGKITEPFRYKKPQSRFEGSLRFYRGKILKVLSSKNTTLQSIQREIKIDNQEFNGLIKRLIKEGLVEKRGTVLLLPRHN